MHPRQSSQGQVLETVDRDARADDATRRVAIGEGRVTIRRRLAGIDMHVAVPVATYSGVVLAIAEEESGQPYRVSLTHADPDLSVTLLHATEDCDAMAGWQHWARVLDLPALVDAPAPLPVTGAGETVARRANLSAIARRPRFAARRKMGQPRLLSLVHRGEREIVCYE